MSGNYPITTPDGSQLDLSSLNHVYTYSDSGKILTDTVIANCRFYPFTNALGVLKFLPSRLFYYTQTYTYDIDDNPQTVSQWTQGDPYDPIPDSSNLITQDGLFFVTQDGQNLVTQ